MIKIIWNYVLDKSNTMHSRILAIAGASKALGSDSSSN